MKHLSLLAVPVCFLLLLPGCEGAAEEEKKGEKFPFDIETFQKEKSEWLKKNYKNYSFSFKYADITAGHSQCYAQIKDKMLVTVVPEDREGRYKDAMGGTTISDLYAKTETLINRAKTVFEQGDPHIGLTIRYNTTYHYPEYIHYWSGPGDPELMGGDFVSDTEITDFALR